jgi:GAF domain-containing protein
MRVGRDIMATIGAGYRPVLAEIGIESACLLPMSARGRRVGTIVVGRRRGESFDDEDVAILAAAAGQIAFAVANALAFRRSQRCATSSLSRRSTSRTRSRDSTISKTSSASRER